MRYTTPGVYAERVDRRPPTIAPLRTDIAGFVGIARKGPLNRAVRVTSWRQFTGLFGGTAPFAYLAEAVQGFFANGGQTCWVVRVGNPNVVKPARLALVDAFGDPVLELTAREPGAWGNNLRAELALHGASRFTLTLSNRQGERELWRDMSMDLTDEREVSFLLGTEEEPTGSQLVRIERLTLDNKTPVKGLPLDTIGPIPFAGGFDGLANLDLADFTGDGAGGPEDPRGLAALEDIDEVSLIAMPDLLPKPKPEYDYREPNPRCYDLSAPIQPLQPPADPDQDFPQRFNQVLIGQGQRAMIAHCLRLRDRVALLDPPSPDLLPEQITAWRDNFNTSYAALYYPWVRVPNGTGSRGLLRNVPPSGHMAGVCAAGDLRVGVWQPPANAVLEGVRDLTYTVDDPRHGLLNEEGVNVIRAIPGRDIRPMGARTLTTEPGLRFLNVRRLLIMIAEAVSEQTQWTVFEPNNRALWRKVERAVEGFLRGLWQNGGLDGATTDEAFFVKCDETTNPPEETDNGRLICLFGVAPPYPVEFVIVRIGITEGGIEVLSEEAGNG